MTPEQLVFELPVRQARGRTAFFVAPPNALALAELDRWRTWPAGKLALIGPEGAGKSHMARIWADEARALIVTPDALPGAQTDLPAAIVVEDAAGVAGTAERERALLHLHNRVLENGGRLLLTARIPPARWGTHLPDLHSRMAATPTAHIAPPDDALLAAVLVKLFEDRQIAAPEGLIAWALPRIERSFAAAQAFVAALDARALATGYAIGPRLAAEVLDEATDDTS